MEKEMNLYLKKGYFLQIQIDWKFLHVMYAVLSLIKQNISGENKEFAIIYFEVETALREKIKREKEAERFHLCAKCFKEIDTEKDKYHHTVFESGYEIYSHQVCPAVNKGKGYDD